MVSVKTLVASLCLVLIVAASAQAETHIVTLAGTSFTPDSLRIRPGDVVRWEVASGVHTTTNGTGAADPAAGTLWDEPLSGAGANFEYTFDRSGVFPYFCRPHEGLGMKGKIYVVGAVPATSTITRIGLIVMLLLLAAYYLRRKRINSPTVAR